MRNTRRAFGLSSLGFGAAWASGRPFADRADEQRTVKLHEDPNLSCFAVSLARGSGAEVFAGFVRSTPGSEVGDILLTRSDNGGVTWSNSSPVVLFSSGKPHRPTGGYQHAALTYLSNGTLIAATTNFTFLFEGKIGWRRGSQIEGVYLRSSSNGGSTWDEPRKIDTSPFRRAWTRGPLVELPDGTLLLPLAGQRNDSYAGLNEPISSFLLRSEDRGASWTFHAAIAQGSCDFDEPALVSLGGERLVCALRCHDAPRRDPLGGYLYMTASADGGISWTRPQVTSMWGHPAHLVRLQDGRLLCSYGYRMHPNPGVRACISDDGLTWKPSEIFTVSVSDVDSEHLDIGCPSTIEIASGSILTGYQVWAETKKPVNNSASTDARQSLEITRYRV